MKVLVNQLIDIGPHCGYAELRLAGRQAATSQNAGAIFVTNVRRMYLSESILFINIVFDLEVNGLVMKSRENCPSRFFLSGRAAWDHISMQ